MDEIEINPEYILTSTEFHKWKHRARSVQPHCEETIMNLERLLEHFKHCIKEFEYPEYPEALCVKLSKEIEDRVKLARDVEKALNQLIEEGAGFDVHGEEFDVLLDVMKELITLESKLSRIVDEASTYLELKDKEEQGE